MRAQKVLQVVAGAAIIAFIALVAIVFYHIGKNNNPAVKNKLTQGNPVSGNIFSAMDPGVRYPSGWVVIKVRPEESFKYDNLQSALKDADWENNRHRGILLVRGYTKDNKEIEISQVQSLSQMQ